MRIRQAALILSIVVALALLGAGAASAKTVWLCKPGQRPDPCTPGLSTTVYSPKLKPLRVVHPRAERHPAIDCFYVYPTVSDQKTAVANRHVDPEERSIALYQAARYSQYCRVFAPMYRQVTLAALFSHTITPRQRQLGLADVRAAFRTYLERYNHGRGFVLIGHSQGSFLLRQLIARDVDRKPAVRRRLVSAILLGGNVLVKRGRRVGGDFEKIPGCHAVRQTGCVIAFSTFDQPPPQNSAFGRTAVKGEEVLCSNPAALDGGAGNVGPISPSKPFAPGTEIALGISALKIEQPSPKTVWWSQPGSYRARCVDEGGANVLEINSLHGAQVASPSPDATWGLHLIDANIALGDLIDLVRREARAFAARAR